jgi:hypothetical protein
LEIASSQCKRQPAFPKARLSREIAESVDVVYDRNEKGAPKVKLPKLTAVIEKEGKWYVATCPELGIASQGRTLEEAEAMIQRQWSF